MLESRKTKPKKLKIIVSIISITGILLIMGGVSFGFWKVTDTQEKENKLISDCLKLKIEEEQDIKLENALPIKNSEGTKLKPYQVSIENVCEIEARYQVNIEVLKSEKRLKSKYIRVKVNNEESKGLEEYERSEGILENEESYKVGEGHLREKQVMRYEIRMWMDETTEATEETMNKIFKSKVTIEGEIEKTEGEYKEEILHGADPVIKGDLIPVTIDNKGTVRKADINKKWYNYANQEWANAIILNEDKIADDYQVNEQIPESDIESYFVWIPKYQYKLFDMGKYNQRETSEYESKVQPIEIQFGITNTTDNETECIAPASGEDGECQEGKWMTHPAFTAFETNGIWVGKFKTGYKGAKNTAEAEQDGDSSKIIIKPNEYSWRNISVGKMYQNSINYDQDLNSHMMKNTEWGAVAYLTNSIYGRCSGNECSEIRMNNNSSRLTGYVAKNEPTTGWTNTNELCNTHPSACNEYGTSEKGQDGDVNYQYFNTNSVIASTTGNYTGIYDMSGGSWEYVMGVMIDEDGKPIYLNSDLKEEDLTDEKYYDKYKYSTKDYQYSNRILGDATGEMGPFILERYTGTTSTAIEQTRTISGWYHDEGWFVLTGYPWFRRGGHCDNGFGGGVFTFSRGTGEALTDRAFRLALAF